MNYSRALITFAFVADKFKNSGDITEGLMPLFSSVIAKRAGEEFNPKTFSADVAAQYDIVMHPYAAEALAPKLVSAGFLEVVKIVEDVTVYKNLKTPEPPLEIDDKVIADAVAGFVEFADSAIRATGRTLAKGIIEHNFLQNLKKPEFLAIFQSPDQSFIKRNTLSLRKKESPKEGDDNWDVRLDFLCADYLQRLFETNRPLFDLLSNISTGVLISEVILNLQSPEPQKRDLKGLTIIVDGPLIMDALNLNDSQHKDYSVALLDQLKAADVRLAIFPHMLDEIIHAIKAPLDNVRYGLEAYGPIVRKLRGDASFHAYLTTILADPVKRIGELGIVVIDMDADRREKALKYFTEGEEQRLSNNIGTYPNHDDARVRDAKTTSEVFRWRNKEQVRSALEAVMTFVTRNARLAKLSTQYLVRNNYIKDDSAPPCISDRYLAGLLWITFGGAQSTLTQLRLIANCASAIAPRRAIVTKMYQFLRDIDAGKARTFEAIMTDERAAHFLVEKTLGDSKLLTKDNYLEIYEEMRAKTAQEVLEKKNAEIEELKRIQRETLERIKGQSETGQKALEEKYEALKVQTAEIELEKGLLESSKQQYSDALKREKEQGAQRAERQIEACMRDGINAGKRVGEFVTWGSLLTMLILAVIDHKYRINELGASSRLLAVLFWSGIALAVLIPFLKDISFVGRFIDGVSQRRRDRRFLKEMKRIGLDGILGEYEIDWNKPSANRRK